MAFKFILFSALLAFASAGYVSPNGYSTTYTHHAPATVLTKVVSPAHDTVATTHQNVVRSFAGTVSQYSKAIDTPYSSVRKEDTRITNHVHTPSYAAHYGHSVPTTQTTTVYTHAAPLQQHHQHQDYEQLSQHYEHPEQYEHEQQAHSSPLYTHVVVPSKTVQYSSPATHGHVYPIHRAEPTPAPQVYHPIAQPQQVYEHVAPAAQHAVYHHSAAAPTTSTTTTTYNHSPAASTYTHNSPGVAAYGSSQTVRYSPAEMVSHMSFDGFGTHWGY